MLTEQELEIVQRNKEPQFGAFLQDYGFNNHSLTIAIKNGEYPAKEDLSELNESMNAKMVEFNCRYFHSLPLEPVNPLQAEQTAWRLLSPRVKSQVATFRGFLTTYAPELKQPEPLLTHLGNGLDLIHQWNIISNSYKCKLERMWDELPKREEEVQGLIATLSGQE